MRKERKRKNKCFIAGYLMSFIVPKMEEKIPDGLDLIVIICVAAPLTRGIAGMIAVLFGFNPAKTVLIAGGLCMVTGILSGYIGSLVFKNYPIKTVSDIRK